MQRVTRRWWLLASLCAPVCLGLTSQPLNVRLDGDDLRVSSPYLHFISGKPLERLKDGAAVVFLGQLSLSTDSNATVFRRAVNRFVVSYDIWEERFSIAAPGRSVSHLSAAAAESWCLDNLAIGAPGLMAGQPFWVRLELRVEDPRDTDSMVGEPGLSLSKLVEIFSRPARGQEPRWELKAGPLRLANLSRS